MHPSLTPTRQELEVPPKLPPHVRMVVNRTGRPYYYLQRFRGTNNAHPQIRLPDDPRSPEFWEAYARHLNIAPQPPRTDTMAALITAWQLSPEWTQMKPRTQTLWGSLANHIVDAWGPLEVKGVRPRHVLALRDALASQPAKANNLMRCLGSVMSWSVPRGWRDDNPCSEIKPLKGGEGYDPWPWDVIESAERELSSKRPDLWWAVALALYTGQRMGDVLAMRWSAINAGGIISVKQGKTGKELFIPLHKDLRAVLDGIPRHAVTILTSAERTPWQTGFQVAWAKHKPQAVRDKALVFHGLRKSAVVMLLEAGCTDAEVASVTGQSRQMIEWYAKQVNQGKLSRAAMLKWETAGR